MAARISRAFVSSSTRKADLGAKAMMHRLHQMCEGLGSLALRARKLHHRGGWVRYRVPGAGVDSPALTPRLTTLAWHQLGELLGKILVGRRLQMDAQGLAEERVALANPDRVQPRPYKLGQRLELPAE